MKGCKLEWSRDHETLQKLKFSKFYGVNSIRDWSSSETSENRTLLPAGAWHLEGEQNPDDWLSFLGVSKDVTSSDDEALLTDETESTSGVSWSSQKMPTSSLCIRLTPNLG